MLRGGRHQWGVGWGNASNRSDLLDTLKLDIDWPYEAVHSFKVRLTYPDLDRTVVHCGLRQS